MDFERFEPNLLGCQPRHDKAYHPHQELCKGYHRFVAVDEFLPVCATSKFLGGVFRKFGQLECDKMLRKRIRVLLPKLGTEGGDFCQ
jgi:hypothetical protein